MIKTKLKVRMVQMDVGHEVERNIEKAVLLSNLEQDSADLDVAVFPEMFTTGFLRLKNIVDRSHLLNDSLIKKFQILAKKSNTHILLGSVALKDQLNGAVTNTTLVINRRGEIISRYDKVYLFPLMKEPSYLTAGSKVHLFHLDGVPCSSIICYDLRFPELMTRILEQGCFDLLFVPMQWPCPREKVFSTLARARAIENQSFVVAVNRVGRDDQTLFPGGSMVINPYGEVVFQLQAEEGCWDVEIDLSQIGRAREILPSLEKRRSEVLRLVHA